MKGLFPMIQDIKPHLFHVEYLPSSPKENDIVFIFSGTQIVLTCAENYWTYRQVRERFPKEYFRFLFHIDETACFFLDYPENLRDQDLKYALPVSCVFRPIRVLRYQRPMNYAFAGYTAWHLVSWYKANRFCGRCGHSLTDGTDERKLVCPHCGNIIYPRINPCIIVAVHDGDRLLMTKYAGRSVTWFVLIAGFIEIGESAEDTVHREVMEETGVRVKNIRYFGSQPWGIPGNLTLGYTAELDGSDRIHIDANELSDGQWIRRDQVPVPDDELSITAAMIRAFSQGKF